MGKLLFKTFIKDYTNVEDPKVREEYGKLAGIVGIITNALLSVLKICIGIFTGSIAIIADGINNLMDISTSTITLIGFKLSAMPEDKEHPYGHARLEYLTGLLISALIIVVGVQLFISSSKKVLAPDPLQFSLITIVILLAAIAVKIWQSLFYFKAGKAIHSLALLASGTDSKIDVLATSCVLLSLLIGKLTGLMLDGIVGCLVSLFIIWTGIQLVRETSSPLLGEHPDPELVDQIAQKAQSFEGVLGLHDLVVHNYGPRKIFASLHIEVDADADLMESHDLIDDIERTLSQSLNIHLVVHMDPIRVNDPLIDELHQTILGLIKLLPGVSGMHDLRIVPGYTHTNVIFDLVLLPECRLKEHEIKEFIQKGIQEVNPTYFLSITFDKSYTLHTVSPTTESR